MAVAAPRATYNHCKRILEDRHAQLVQAKVENKSLGSHEFWKISNQILNKGKETMPTIINGPGVIFIIVR